MSIKLSKEEYELLDKYRGNDPLRFIRNMKLTSSDWTQLPDVNILNKQEWAIYRQALRDITNEPAWPKVSFPTAPASNFEV